MQVQLKISKLQANNAVMPEYVNAYIDTSNVKSYVALLTKTFPKTNVAINNKLTVNE